MPVDAHVVSVGLTANQATTAQPCSNHCFQLNTLHLGTQLFTAGACRVPATQHTRPPHTVPAQRWLLSCVPRSARASAHVCSDPAPCHHTASHTHALPHVSTQAQPPGLMGGVCTPTAATHLLFLHTLAHLGCILVKQAAHVTQQQQQISTTQARLLALQDESQSCDMCKEAGSQPLGPGIRQATCDKDITGRTTCPYLPLNCLRIASRGSTPFSSLKPAAAGTHTQPAQQAPLWSGSAHNTCGDRWQVAAHQCKSCLIPC